MALAVLNGAADQGCITICYLLLPKSTIPMLNNNFLLHLINYAIIKTQADWYIPVFFISLKEFDLPRTSQDIFSLIEIYCTFSAWYDGVMNGVWYAG